MIVVEAILRGKGNINVDNRGKLGHELTRLHRLKGLYREKTYIWGSLSDFNWRWRHRRPRTWEKG
jgi:hypothetical protein